MEEKNIYTMEHFLKNLDEKVEAVYRHASLMFDYSNRMQDYGNGCFMSEVEAHTLWYICKHDRVTVTHLAAETFRTKGTISKLLKRLEEKGLIDREQKEENRKWVYFYATDEGRKVNDLHQSYDCIKTLEMVNTLLEDCTLEEVESFYKVTQLRIKFLTNQKKESETAQ